MKFLNLELNNFLSIGKAKVALSDRGLVLIEGKNMDDPSAKSNGAGKSSIVDGLCFCLYGKTARGVSGDAVINRKAKKKCMASITIEADDGETYTINRFRKNPDSGLTVTNKGNDISKGTVAETQEFIESLIGCPYEVFIAVVYAGQDAMPDLPNMSDRQLKELIEKIIGVERLSKSYVEALSRVNAANAKLSELRTAFDGAESLLEYQKRNLEQTQSRSNNWLSERNAELARLSQDIEGCRANSSAITAECKAIYDKYQSLFETEMAIQKQIASFDEQQKLSNQLQREVWGAQRAYEEAVAGKNDIRQQAIQVANSIRDIEKDVGTKCKECGKIIEEADLAEYKQSYMEKLANLRDEFKACDGQIEQLALKLDDKQKQHQRALESISSLSTLQGQIRQISEGKDLYNRARAKLERADSDLSRAQENVKLKKEEIARGNPFVAQIDQSMVDIQKQEEVISDIKKRLIATERESLIAQKVRDVFGSGGVRQHILETITPVLNERTARYLDILSDGKLKAVWSTLTTNKSGVVKEKFNIEVTNSVGGGSFDSLSGGEKRKVRLACCLALQELVASRASKPIDLFIADEVDHALDESGVERLIGVLNEKARICKTLLVISHNPLRNWIDDYITVIKEGGVSTVEEY